jgi:hypothetical protein
MPPSETACAAPSSGPGRRRAEVSRGLQSLLYATRRAIPGAPGREWLRYGRFVVSRRSAVPVRELVAVSVPHRTVSLDGLYPIYLIRTQHGFGFAFHGRPSKHLDDHVSPGHITSRSWNAQPWSQQWCRR